MKKIEILAFPDGALRLKFTDYQYYYQKNYKEYLELLRIYIKDYNETEDRQLKILDIESVFVYRGKMVFVAREKYLDKIFIQLQPLFKTRFFYDELLKDLLNKELVIKE